MSYSPVGRDAPPGATTAADVRDALRNGQEIALLDVRPEGPFSQAHPLFAASLPLGRLEAEVSDRFPRRTVPVVAYDGGDGSRSRGTGLTGTGTDALAAVARLRELGYSDVTILDGGLDGWTASGGELFRDVNVPSKAFGELVAERAGTPFLPAPELAARLADDRSPCVVVDARRFDEFAVMSIPTATSVPGAELVLRAPVLAPDPGTTIVVNCAGRTRSIIGTQSLINAGTKNPVAALRNGTIGWSLAGLDLDHGSERKAPDTTPEDAARAQAAAWAVAMKAGVRRIPAGDVPGGGDLPGGGTTAGGPGRTVYRFDVRTPEEYTAGHLPGFRSAPGGQLVQETDRYAPVRGALVVLAYDGAGRAAMTASWLAQMNWDVVVAEPDPSAVLVTGDWVPARPPVPPSPEVTLVTPDMLDGWLRDGHAIVLDIDSSQRFRAGRVPGASWTLRTGLPETIQASTSRRVVLTSADGYLAAWAASDLARCLHTGTGDQRGPEVAVLAGGTSAWAASGRPLEAGDPGNGALLSEPVDAYRRPYEGTDVRPDVMQAYLDWEYGLVAQLDRDGTHGFTVLVP